MSSGYVSSPPRAPTPAEGDDIDDPRSKRGAHLHDGFYLRCGLGAGYISAKTQNGSTFKGWGVAPDFWLGGTPAPGLVVGITLNGVSAPHPHAELTAEDTGGLGARSGDAQGVLTYSVLGVFGDYYPNVAGGLHVMAGVNLSLFRFTADNGVASTPASGLGLLGGVGYEWWVGRQWSIGPLARLHWASVNDVEAIRVLVPVIVLAGTYH